MIVLSSEDLNSIIHFRINYILRYIGHSCTELCYLSFFTTYIELLIFNSSECNYRHYVVESG